MSKKDRSYRDRGGDDDFEDEDALAEYEPDDRPLELVDRPCCSCPSATRCGPCSISCGVCSWNAS